MATIAGSDRESGVRSRASRGRTPSLACRSRLWASSRTRSTREGGLAVALQLMHECPAAAGDDRHLRRPGGAVAEAVGSRLVDVEVVMGMLDRGGAAAAGG